MREPKLRKPLPTITTDVSPSSGPAGGDSASMRSWGVASMHWPVLRQTEEEPAALPPSSAVSDAAASRAQHAASSSGGGTSRGAPERRERGMVRCTGARDEGGSAAPCALAGCEDLRKL